MKFSLVILFPVVAMVASMMHPTIFTQTIWQSDNPVGQWQRTTKNGSIWVWHIKEDGTFSFSTKGHELVQGHYRIDRGIYDVNDPNCNNAYHGRYRFSIEQDSIRFQAIEDTCRTRRAGMHNIGWKRILG